MRPNHSVRYSSNALVLENRPIREGTVASSLSRFSDETWDLTPAVFEEHSTKVSISFGAFSIRWREPVKTYLWVLINYDEVRPVPGAAPEARPSVRSISMIKSSLALLFSKVDAMGITDLQLLDQESLQELAIDLAATSTYSKGRKVLTEVRRLWSYRDIVSSPLRMLPGLPWNGDKATDLLPAPPRATENKTARISDATLLPLMSWALRFVEDLSDDILSSFAMYRRLILREYRHRPGSQVAARSEGHAKASDNLRATLRTLKQLGLGLPGRVHSDGHREVQLQHLGRLAQSNPQWLAQRHSDVFAEFGLEIDDEAYLPVACLGMIDGKLWRSKPLVWSETPIFATRLQTACFLVISYLSGMRPGEVLSLRRDCLSFDAGSGIWTVTGSRWKAARDERGAKLPEGEQRDNPWVIHPAAARAVRILEALHEEELLFPTKVRPQPIRGNRPPENLRSGQARTSSQIGTDISEFIAWVNSHVGATGHSDAIPDDPHGRINARRLRRTLAWHIVRRPRGLVAAAIQYGHIATYITQGYAGNYASGFPDDLAFERWLARFEQLSELDAYVKAEGRISGPAADELATRAAGATRKYGGRVLPTHRQAATLLRDPLLQVYPGDGMHCVFNAETALCARDTTAPVLSACKTGCNNVARTDSDIETIASIAMRLRDDRLAPPIRHARNQTVLERLEAIIDEHKVGDPT